MKTPPKSTPQTLFIEARRRFPNINFFLLNKIPGKKISLAATIQYLNLVPQVKEYLEKKGKKVVIKQGAVYKAHVIGCNPRAFDKSADTLLLLTDGKFHALNNAIQLNKEIYIFNTKNLQKITRQEINKHKQKTKAKISKFLSQDKIGIITSTKPGQHYNIGELKNKLKKIDKNPYIFKADTIDTQELENFPQIQIWLNTACPGLALDSSKILNLADVQSFI